MLGSLDALYMQGGALKSCNAKIEQLGRGLHKMPLVLFVWDAQQRPSPCHPANRPVSSGNCLELPIRIVVVAADTSTSHMRINYAQKRVTLGVIAPLIFEHRLTLND